MEWAPILAYITGTVDHELLLRNEYLAAENRIELSRCRGIEACCETGSSHASLDGGWSVWNYWTGAVG